MEGDIVHITNYDYDKYFSIPAWGKSGVTCDAKERGKYQKKERKVMFIINYNCRVCFLDQY